MVAVKSKVIGLDTLTGDLLAIARTISPQGGLADSLAAGAEIILETARENLLANELFRSGDLYDSGKVVKVNQYRVDVIFDKVYAAIHEYGGTIDIPVTQKMRGYFFWRHSVTGDEKWLFMALSKKDVFKVVIPARPYLRPAMATSTDDAVTHVARKMRQFMERA